MYIKTATEFHRTKNNKFFDVSSFVAAYHFVAAPDVDLGWEKYDFTQIILMISGNATYTTEHESFVMTPGTIVFHPAFEACQFTYQKEDDVRFAVVDFVCDSPAMQVFHRPPLLLQEEERATLYDLMRTAARICYPVEEEEHEGMKVRPGVPPVMLSFVCASLERFLCMLYCRLSGIGFLTDETEKVSKHLGDSRLVEEVKIYLADNLEKHFTLGDVCAHFWVSRTALSRKFRKVEGKGVMDYFIDLKIDEAKTRIRRSAESFTAIAEELGFSSVGYFSKIFKGRVGMTPTEYSKYSSKRRAAAADEG